jgi:hypothetical protein
MITAGAAALVIVTFLVQAYAWYWPHELRGLLDEAWLLVLSAALAALISVPLRLLRNAPRYGIRGASIAFACLYLGAILAEVRVHVPADIRIAPRTGYLYAADGCEFAVRFPRRPHESVVTVALGGDTVTATLATESDVARASFYRAECVAFAAPLTPAQRAALATGAPQHMTSWAAGGGVTVESVSASDSADPAIVMRGRIETVDELNQPRIARIQARTLIGNVSMLTLLVSELGAEDAPPTAAETFLLSARRR